MKSCQTKITRRHLFKTGGLALGSIGLSQVLSANDAAARVTAKLQAEAGPMMEAPEPNPKRGGILRTAWGATTAHNDIHQGANSTVLVHMYDGLMTKNLADGLRTIVPALATGWETSADGKTYTFDLRSGVEFHDGTPFSSDDVVATFTRIIDPPDGIISVFKDQLAPVEAVRAVDPMTVEFVLQHPWTPFLEVIASPAMIIYSKKSLDENEGDLRQVMAPGTGPFIFKDHRVGEKWDFERNPNYWNPALPYVDGLEMLDVPAWTDRGTAVLTGQADFSWNVSPQTWEEGITRNDIEGSQIPCLNSHTTIINNEREPFDNPLVRRAIHLAVSRQNMILALETQEPVFVSRWMPGSSPYAMPIDEILNLPGYRADKEADIEEARNLMAEAGFPDGFDGVDMVTASVPQWADINAPTFQDELRRTLNIRSTIRLVERGLLSEEYKRGDFDMVQEAAFESNYIDPTVLWTSYLKTGASLNWSRYSNPDLDTIIDQLNVESDEQERAELFSQGMDVLDENPPFYLIGFCAHSPMWRSNVKGLAMEDRLHVEWGRLDTVWLDD